jgi:hypothetical protein
MQSDDGQGKDQKDGARDAAEEERMNQIMQYCDGVLPAREAMLVAEEIARDPEAARLAAELSAGAGAARMAWASLDADPVPFEIARRVTQAARKPAPAATAGMRADWRMAASFVAGIALGMLGLLLTQHHDDRGLRLAGANDNPATATGQPWAPALMHALSKDPELASVAFGGTTGAISIARWFDTATGLRCAEFVATTAGAPKSGGIACRKSDGSWDVIEQSE